MKEPLVLGIESTCDETGFGIVRGGKLLADVTATSMAAHERFGGIIPEIASRAHLESFLPTLGVALENAEVQIQDLDAIAVAAGPGLIGSLTVGTAGAKALAVALGKPIYGVNHVISHIAVDELVNGPFPESFIALVVSGGHTSLFQVDEIATAVTELGSTLDDAAGEAFDKVGRLLGLPYPGGPHVDRLAREGNRSAISFPRGLRNVKDPEKYRYDFSFSGLKTAVARYVESLEDSGEPLPTADIAASFSEAVNDVLTRKALEAAALHGASTLVIGGGFSANSRLRELAQERADEYGVTVRIPPMRYCTDNGAMIAAMGAACLRAGVEPSALDFPNDSSLNLSRAFV